MYGKSKPSWNWLTTGMGRLGRDVVRRKLSRQLQMSLDEEMCVGIAAISILQSGNSAPRELFVDYPAQGIGSETGSEYNLPLWTLETLTNEMLSSPKQSPPRKYLRPDLYANYRALASLVMKLENAEDGIFLAKHDVFTEMHRIGQRQFPWQRGWLNGPNLYRALAIYGSGEAASYFEQEAGLTISQFVLIGMWLGGALSSTDKVNRDTDLSTVGVSPDQLKAALTRLVISHERARSQARRMRERKMPTAYKPSILRDYPIIAFGSQGERLRAPLPDLIGCRITSGLYLDVVGGGPKVWKHIGDAFETYCVEYLRVMLSTFDVTGEIDYGPKRARLRSPDVLVSRDERILLVAECKAKRMTLEARFADNPVAEAALGYEEIAKGIFQIWRFFAHARRGLVGGAIVHPDCIGVVLTVDPWLAMARNQEREVYEVAHKLADETGEIEEQDRRHIAVCLIDDVEHALQRGTPDSFLSACKELTSGDKRGWIVSVAHVADQLGNRAYPFSDRISELLPWWSDLERTATSG